MSDPDQMERSLSVSPGGDESVARRNADVSQETRNRILEHRLHALENSSPLQAVLESVAADLLDSQAFTARILRAEFAAENAGLEELEALAPSVDLQVRLAKQIGQLTQLSRQIARDDADNAASGRGSKSRARRS